MNEFDKFKVGEKHIYQKKITEKDAAHNYGTKKLNNLFATPGLVAMVIEASVEFLDNRLSEGNISIGHEFGITHIHSTEVGETVTLKLTVEDIQSQNEIIFIKFEAFDEIDKIATGVHVRSVVNRDAFFEKIDKRMEKLKKIK